jgi:hypothetical protein
MEAIEKIKDSKIKLDFIIDERNCEEAIFDYYLDELIIIKS